MATPVPPGGGIPAATSSVAGLMSAAQAANLGVAGPQPATLMTPTLNFAATQTAVPMSVALPGFFFIPISFAGSVLYTTTGALSTSPTWNAGNDASHINLIASSTPNLSTAFTTGAPVFGAGGTGTSNASIKKIDLAAPVLFDLTAAATGTGGFALTGRLCIFGVIVPSS